MLTPQLATRHATQTSEHLYQILCQWVHDGFMKDSVNGKEMILLIINFIYRENVWSHVLTRKPSWKSSGWPISELSSNDTEFRGQHFVRNTLVYWVFRDLKNGLHQLHACQPHNRGSVNISMRCILKFGSITTFRNSQKRPNSKVYY